LNCNKKNCNCRVLFRIILKKLTNLKSIARKFKAKKDSTLMNSRIHQTHQWLARIKILSFIQIKTKLMEIDFMSYLND